MSFLSKSCAIIALGALCCTTSYAQDAGVSFAPAPITKPLEDGETSKRGRFGLISIEDDDSDFELTGFSINAVQNTGGGPGFDVGMFYATDSDGDIDMLNMSVGVNFQKKKDNLVLFGGAPLNMGLISVDVGFTTIDITNISIGILGGVEYIAPIDDQFDLAVFGMVGFDSGSSSVDGGDSESYTSSYISFGVDFMFNDASLAAMIQTGDTDVFVFSFGYDF